LDDIVISDGDDDIVVGNRWVAGAAVFVHANSVRSRTSAHMPWSTTQRGLVWQHICGCNTCWRKHFAHNNVGGA
jgi:hypothetical protein